MDATDQAKTVSDDANTFLTDYNATYVYLGLADYAFGQAATAANSDINSLDTSSTSSYLDKCSSALKQTKKDLDALEQDAPDADFSSYKDAYDSLSTTIDDYIALIDKLNQKDLAGAQSIAQTLDSQVDDLKKKSKAMDSVSSALKKLVTDDDKQNAKSLKSDFNDIDSNVSDLSDDPLVGDTMSTSKFA